MIVFDIKEFKKLLKNDKKILCLDVGLVKIGLALSDTSHTFSLDYLLLNRKIKKISSEIFSEIIKKENVYGIVVGYPLQMDGSEGNSCSIVRNFINKHLIKLGHPIYLQDERLSTATVNKALKDSQLSRKEREEINDIKAACYILQITLDKLRLITE